MSVGSHSRTPCHWVNVTMCYSVCVLYMSFNRIYYIYIYFEIIYFCILRMICINIYLLLLWGLNIVKVVEVYNILRLAVSTCAREQSISTWTMLLFRCDGSTSTRPILLFRRCDGSTSTRTILLFQRCDWNMKANNYYSLDITIGGLRNLWFLNEYVWQDMKWASSSPARLVYVSIHLFYFVICGCFLQQWHIVSSKGMERNVCQILAMNLYDLPSSASRTVSVCTSFEIDCGFFLRE